MVCLLYTSGAVFVLYEDTNGDKKLDDNDKLIGELEETDSGVHEMTGLLAKGFFVKEQTAPESFVLDPNAYYFEITEDGQVVAVSYTHLKSGTNALPSSPEI